MSIPLSILSIAVGTISPSQIPDICNWRIKVILIAPCVCVCVCMSWQVCELDIIFNFEKAYFILDEFLMGGEIQDTSKKSVLKAIEQADLLQEVGFRLKKR